MKTALFLGALLIGGCATAAPENDLAASSEAAASAGAGRLVLAYGDRKAEVIASGYFEASDFTGTKIIVASTQTSIDIATIIEDSDGAPNTICWEGDLANVKRILDRMLANTDGNGDHYLDSSSIEGGPRESLKVLFQWTGENGATDHTLDVAKCP